MGEPVSQIGWVHSWGIVAGNPHLQTPRDSSTQKVPIIKASAQKVGSGETERMHLAKATHREAFSPRRIGGSRLNIEKYRQGEKMKWFKLWITILPLTLIACGGEEFSVSSQKAATEPVFANGESTDLITGISPLMTQKNYGLPQMASVLPNVAVEKRNSTSTRENSTANYNTRKINSSNTVYRFLNLVTGVHFYTISMLERANIELYLPQFQFEGPAFFAETVYSPALSPVYRFYNQRTAAHFYTINESEKDFVRNTLSATYTYEGEAWFARTTWAEGWSPMRRFFNTLTGNHFYTASDAEFEQIQANSPYLRYEGVAYYVRNSEPIVIPPVAYGLDPSFGAAGRLVIPHPGPDFPTSVKVLINDKFLIGGNCSSDSLSRDFCVTRHLPDGAIDPSFGANGRSQAPMTNFNQNEMTSMAVQNDGKIVVAGSCTALYQVDRDFCAARFLPNGDLDIQFGNGGKSIISTGIFSQTRVYALSIQADGKILLAGDCSFDFCLIRMLSNGAIDTSFAKNGHLKFGDAYSAEAVEAMAITVDGKILVAGYCRDQFSEWAFCTARIESDGSLDPTFGNAGKVRTTMAPYTGSTVSDMVLQSDGKFIVVGSCLKGAISGYDFCAAKFTPNGTLDSTYGVNGRTFIQVTRFGDTSHAAKELPNGKLVIGGTCQNASYNNKFCSVRLTSLGAIDLAYGIDGKLLLEVSAGGDSVTSIALQSTGKLLQVGACEPAPYVYEACAVRIPQ